MSNNQQSRGKATYCESEFWRCVVVLTSYLLRAAVFARGSGTTTSPLPSPNVLDGMYGGSLEAPCPTHGRVLRRLNLCPVHEFLNSFPVTQSVLIAELHKAFGDVFWHARIDRDCWTHAFLTSR